MIDHTQPARETGPDGPPGNDDGATKIYTRPLGPALRRGWRRRCPNCGAGPLLKGYLKVHDDCSVCRQELHHQRADDGPAYLTILIVGHLMAPMLHFVFSTWRPEPLTLFTIFAIGCITLSLYLLPRLKGAMIGFQWAREMHGFGKGDADDFA
ncbi:DUF983 domain-containing protein [Alisedimentitalea sp. MJ-SS2]|uniref:DUF983 domain-containing protein n=1 Tax=Aliisedimentitalea sp. MJ-SS2 TaxID=3049795 RepID=UPI00290B5836|nr:DUF983 domain-containing protein [Alisedimentitalea sp. MJ-SS2]MDU8927131.1 DUF983 domain-containing protein [Alisedimentitalea sp. MJ-SS2]